MTNKTKGDLAILDYGLIARLEKTDMEVSWRNDRLKGWFKGESDGGCLWYGTVTVATTMSGCLRGDSMRTP